MTKAITPPVGADWSPAGLARMYAQFGDQLQKVSGTLGAFAAITELAVTSIPGAEFSGITRARRGKFDTVAPTNDIVRDVDEIQYALGNGPCLAAADHGRPYRASDLRTDPRFLDFGQRAHRRTGVTSMLAFRLFTSTDEDLVASLNLYACPANAFDETSTAFGTLLATHGALALQAATASAKAEQLTAALRTSRQIGTAVGVLIAQHKLTREQAFDLLRIASQNSNRKIAELAEEVVDTGELPLPAPQ